MFPVSERLSPKRMILLKPGSGVGAGVALGDGVGVAVAVGVDVAVAVGVAVGVGVGCAEADKLANINTIPATRFKLLRPKIIFPLFPKPVVPALLYSKGRPESRVGQPVNYHSISGNVGIRRRNLPAILQLKSSAGALS
jgi:hypothetical protein